MAQRHNVAAVFAILTITTLIFLRHHLRDFAEVVRTYATFYPYLKQHPETLYRFPASIDGHQSQEAQQNIIVPPILHHIFLSEGRNTTLSK